MNATVLAVVATTFAVVFWAQRQVACKALQQAQHQLSSLTTSLAVQTADLAVAHQTVADLEGESALLRSTITRNATEAERLAAAERRAAAEHLASTRRLADAALAARTEATNLAESQLAAARSEVAFFSALAAECAETNRIAEAKLAAADDELPRARKRLTKCYQRSGPFAVYLAKIERLWEILNVCDETSKVLRLQHGLAPRLLDALADVPLKEPSEEGAYSELCEACLWVDPEPEAWHCKQCRTRERLIETPHDGVFCVDCCWEYFDGNPCTVCFDIHEHCCGGPCLLSMHGP